MSLSKSFTESRDLLNDGEDDIFNKAYTAYLRNKFVVPFENLVECDVMSDGEDDILNESYEASLPEIEKAKNVRIVQNEKRPSLIPENMLHSVQNSKKEIERNHLLAKVRLREGKIPWIRRYKEKLSDYFFLVETWPNYAIKLLFTREFNYSERIALACFLHGNGLKDVWKAQTIFQMYNSFWDRARHTAKKWNDRFSEFRNLFTYLEQINKCTDTGARLKREYYYYDMGTNLTMYYDGNVRMRNGEKRKYFTLFKKY